MVYWILTLAVGIIATWYPYHALTHTATDVSQHAHIVLSSLAFSVLCVAALQACLLAWQERQLHHKKVSSILRMLPSLESMERLLSQFILLGFTLLSLVLLTSFSFLRAGLTPYLMHKLVLAVLAWIVFATVLWGRYRLGWRGQTLVRWTLGGVGLVVITYFASQQLLIH